MTSSRNQIIIFLNGPSSSGKTTVASCLQERYDKPIIHIGSFSFMNFIHPKFRGVKDEQTRLGFYFTPRTLKGRKVYDFKMGIYGKKVLGSAFTCLKVLSRDGHDLIVEDVVTNHAQLSKYFSAFQGHRVYFVAVKCPLQVIELRELQRADRIPGQSRAVFSKVYPKGREYDVEVDTSRLTTEECAEIILEYIINTPQPTAWQNLHRRRR